MPPMPLDQYEYRRWGTTSLSSTNQFKVYTKSQKELYLTSAERYRLLREAEISPLDMDIAMDQIEIIRRQREFTRDHMLPWMKVEQVVESAQRMAKKVLTKKTH